MTILIFVPNDPVWIFPKKTRSGGRRYVDAILDVFIPDVSPHRYTLVCWLYRPLHFNFCDTWGIVDFECRYIVLYEATFALQDEFFADALGRLPSLLFLNSSIGSSFPSKCIQKWIRFPLFLTSCGRSFWKWNFQHYWVRIQFPSPCFLFQPFDSYNTSKRYPARVALSSSSKH